MIENCENCKQLSDSMGLATGIHTGMTVCDDNGRPLAIIATEAFADTAAATVFGAWLRDELTNPESLADFVRILTEERPLLN